nr:hypothetical protein [Tanacetum cinerariifolium]
MDIENVYLVGLGTLNHVPVQNDAHIGYNCPPKVLVVSNPEPCHNQNIDELPQTLSNFYPTYYTGDENSSAHDSIPNFVNDSPKIFQPPPQTLTNSYEFCGNDAHYSYDCPPQVSHDDDENYTIPITPEEPDNSLSMGDEHLDTIPAMKSDEVIKSSVEDLVLIPSESEGIPDNTCDVSFRDNSPPLDVSEDHFEEFFDSNNDSTSIDDNYFSIDNIDYVEASPSDSKLVSLEEVKDDNLREKLLNINLLIAKIKSLNDNPTPDHVLKSPSPSPFPVEDSDSFFEKSDTSLSFLDNSLPEFEILAIIRKRRIGELTSVVILAKPRVYVPNILTTHPTLMLDLDFIPFDNSLPEFKIFYFDIKEKNSDNTTIHADISLLDLECSNLKENPNQDDHSPLFAYVVWIFLSFLTYLIVPQNLHSFGNKDTIFDPGISNYHFSSFMPGVSHQSGTFMKLIVYPNHLNESPMEILSSTTFPKDQ